MMQADEVDAAMVAAVRAFGRFYTRQIGLLEEGLHRSAFSLTEARVLYELAHRDRLTASILGQDLGLDAGYLSRLLKRFEDQGLLSRQTAAGDGRRQVLALTPEGQAAFAPLDAASRAEVGALLARLSAADRAALVGAMARVRHLLGDPSEGPPAEADTVLRDLKPSDLGWITHRQGVLYATEYGFDLTFEALVAEILAGFVRDFDPGRAGAWIAEQGGEILGSVFLAPASETVGKLRLLYVEPSARGQGLGRRLTAACVEGARARGYRQLTLWTNDVLGAARRIYAEAGFRLVEAAPHRSFGQDLVGETWILDL
ncbi:bifunctional helix-turn-helix transcriptional regulator/GNAT family N-acetyltransferase [Methylobacterium currus]|uniref:bifunctional helix-turn-helix transcriptional regulator/GNAT family N-acetyltransferase n=1 Tax=Methylobacterium currus TaxID=2051553 RepID=UPI001E2F10D0|nr:bifunctional helix-turn-helix transcriptional regulator/GNAT family N-acetyltransferase [Methylobacterium currus]UHC14582.1 bifunctional helix-turn-helix transcriptional regulator/GNAT family N-acetyltransferase [Methylobacterium currus]